MKHLYKIALLLLLPLFSIAQSNYKPGYVVTLKGDTLHGYIDFREWDSNPNSINFKVTSADRTAKSFTPREISFFNVANLASYQKYSGKISTDQTDPSHTGTGKDNSFKIADVFLRIIQKGDRVTLFEYADDIKIRFYVAEGVNDTPTELEYRVYNDSGPGITAGKTTNENTYMRQLYNLALKYNVLTDRLQIDIQRSGYFIEDIQKIVNKINGISESKNSKAKLNLFVGAALSITHTAPVSEFINGATPYTSYMPAASFGIDLPVSPNSGKVIFRAELSVLPYQYKSVYNNKVSPYINITYSYNVIGVAIAPQLIYNFYNATNFKFYGGAGMYITSYTYMNKKYKDQSGNTVSSSADPFDFTSVGVPFNLKVGALFNKKIGVFANYITGGPVSHDYVFRLNFSTLQFGMNYYL